MDFLECPICSDIFKQVVETPCCHKCFCKECLATCLRLKNLCPSCRAPLVDLSKCLPNIPLQRMADETATTCPNQGCTDKVTRGILPEHLKKCDFALIDCKFGKQKCQKIVRKDMETHFDTCDYLLVECEKCKKEVLRLKMKEHIDTVCEYVDAVCANNCGISFLKKDINDHKEKCPYEMSKCPFHRGGCGFVDLRVDMPKHLQQKAIYHTEIFQTIQKQLENMELEVAKLKKENSVLNFGVQQLSVLKPPLHHSPINSLPFVFPTAMNGKTHPSVTVTNGTSVSFRKTLFGAFSSAPPVAIVPADRLVPDICVVMDFPYYFEVKILKVAVDPRAPAPTFSIGFADKFHSMKGNLGFDGVGYGYYPYQQQVVGHLEKSPRPYGDQDAMPNSSTSLVVGCGWDQKNRIIFFTLNGTPFGAAFSAVKEDHMFPVIALDQSFDILVNFGEQPFVFRPSGWLQMRKVEVELVKCKEKSQCTYTFTRDGYVPQLVFHCRTCSLTGNMGMCATCATICHKDHNLEFPTYSMGFFCDCGDLEAKKRKPGICKCLV